MALSSIKSIDNDITDTHAFGVGDVIVYDLPAAVVRPLWAGAPFESNPIAQEQVQSSADIHYITNVTQDTAKNRLFWLKTALTKVGNLMKRCSTTTVSNSSSSTTIYSSFGGGSSSNRSSSSTTNDGGSGVSGTNSSSGGGGSSTTNYTSSSSSSSTSSSTINAGKRCQR
ncbi:PH domain-containing rcdII-like [Procambarus clarkii]|uniref:PH domain-containing rcdII-like n=1 Tax=Procambarus clarkii TaxID=6728 RepID=UPI003741EA3F